MNCTQCGQWNPDDKTVCWRCQAELPKPVEAKKKKPALLFGLPLWSWVVLVVFFILLFAGQCLGPLLIPGQ